MSVLVVGSVALDTVKTPHGEAKEVLGGSASYFSLAARRFGDVSMVAVVGEDFPDEHVQLFQTHGVDVSGLETSPGKTFRWSGEYSEDMNSRKTLDTQLGVFEAFKPKLSDAHRSRPFVFLANIHPDLQREVLGQVTEPRLVVLDTMNYWIQDTRESLLETMKHVNVVLLNDEEAKMITGRGNLLAAARAVLDLGPEIAVIKKGEHGATVVTRDYTFVVPAYPLEEVFDPTGAGDTFAGGFLGYLARCGDPGKENEIRKAAAHGVVLASFTVESFGLSRLAEVTEGDIRNRYDALRAMAAF
jgi:sugar/nucleoside kinase (ribokinase family)